MYIIILVLSFLLGVTTGVCFVMVKYISVSKDNAAKKQKINDLIESIEKQTQLNGNLKIEFENIASKVLEEKNAKIVDFNKNSLENVVAPFKMKIDEFKNKVETLQIYEAEKMSGLQKELEKLINLNKQVSEDANSLADALKGENKLQGIWGELSIERIFEYVGMIEGVNYVSQKQFKDDNEKKIPDYIVNLPDEKHIVIDAKTSLSAYEKYYNSQNASDKKTYLKEHSASVKRHIDELAQKDYINLSELNQPEYVLMFIPIEGAISLALADRPDLVAHAFKRNIVIVTPSTLLATLKTVEYIWRQENQKKNVLEIAKQGGNLYDKFVTFVQILIEVEKKISEAKNKTQDAIKRLSSSDKKGDSLIDRAQRLKELGSSTKKNLPEEILKPVK
ncbi:MAG: DNA recombination protein RmuC [Endomicrobium sp.]|jgi:DNA recombination protein RmuC|nr:DNA recombination protein RmuC [Endomicrobium sp.]